MNYLRKMFGGLSRRKFESELGVKPLKTTWREEWISTDNGGRIYTHVHRPDDDTVRPGIVMIPGGGSPGLVFDGHAEVSADDVAALGYVALHYDPSGRGKTGGAEDHWGERHQDELALVIRQFSKMRGVDPAAIAIMSFSIGITIATGTMARHQNDDVKFIFDWEGPSNRFITTKNDTHPPLKKYPTTNMEFWESREAASFIGDVHCGYYRFQAETDHVQGKRKDHAVELVNLATNGNAAWTRLNDNPVNTPIEREDTCQWVSDRENRRFAILRHFLRACGIGFK